tara:strand:- start:955 stop:1350 length:396 start_codon:yes stop_codon:yes gene_type:complete
MKITLIVFLFLFQTLFTQENNRVADVLKEESSALNEMLPMEIDEETRLDITYTINDDTFIYSYSLVNYDKEDFKENDIKAMRLIMEKSITDMWKTNPELVYYRINKVNLIYKYNDKFGKHLFEFSFNAHEI